MSVIVPDFLLPTTDQLELLDAEEYDPQDFVFGNYDLDAWCLDICGDHPETGFAGQAHGECVVPDLPLFFESASTSSGSAATTPREFGGEDPFSTDGPLEGATGFREDAVHADQSLGCSIVACDRSAVPQLQLNYSAVLSAWEALGGAAAVGTEFATCQTVELLVPPPEADLQRETLPSFSYIGAAPSRASSSGSVNMQSMSPMSTAANEAGADTVQTFSDSMSETCSASAAVAASLMPAILSCPCAALPALPESLANIPAKAPECTKSARAACFVRYKEKKLNRQSGKIRYEMRRINAEKRPRIKGRFVKREELRSMLLAGAEREMAASSLSQGSIASSNARL